MEVQLTEEEIEEVDQMMNDHMYSHATSNSYNSFTCDPRCRKQALGYSINKVLNEKDAERVHAFVVSDRSEVGKYKEIYPALLEGAQVFLPNERRETEGRRVNRVFIAESVDEWNSESIQALSHSLALGRREITDTFPIILRLDLLKSFDEYVARSKEKDDNPPHRPS